MEPQIIYWALPNEMYSIFHKDDDFILINEKYRDDKHQKQLEEVINSFKVRKVAV